MRKIFQIIGLISLTCFSFFVTDKTAMVINNLDDIMIQIKQNGSKYNKKSKDAIIKDNKIIPGIKEQNVNINKSYRNMKKYGYYNENLYIYDYKLPSVSLSNNMDKYIIRGNESKQMVSLIFRINNDDDIKDILKVVNNYNIKVSFFTDSEWFSNNNNLIPEIIKYGHNVGIQMDNYSDNNFELMDTIIRRVNKQNLGFCYSEDENKQNISECIFRKNLLIKPRKISEYTPLLDIKNNLQSGDLLSFKINSTTKKQLSTIIIYIKSKGFNIGNLEEHVLE